MRTPLVDGWYGPYLDFPEFSELLRRAPRLVTRAAGIGVLRGVLLFLVSLGRPAVVVVRLDPGWRSLLLLRALLGRQPKLVVLQFLLLPDRGRLADRLWRRVDRWAVPRAVLTACVLTRWEADEYARLYAIDRDRLAYVPWPWRTEPGAELPEYAETGRVVATGRAFCDWSTMAAAARGSAWPLTVICGGADLLRVSALAWPPGTIVRADVPAEEYLGLLRNAALAVFPMVDGHTSQAQIRLMHAGDAAVPVVVSDVKGIEGYVIAEETAVLVPPEDPEALRAAIDRLLDAPERRRALRAASFERSRRWTGHGYGRALEAVIRGEPPRLPEA